MVTFFSKNFTLFLIFMVHVLGITLVFINICINQGNNMVLNKCSIPNNVSDLFLESI